MTKEVPLENGVSRYRIPERAIGSKVRHIYYKDSDGNVNDIARYEQEQIGGLGVGVANRPHGITIEGMNIRIWPAASDSMEGSLVILFHFRPNDLVAESAARTIVSTGADSVTLASIPTGFVSGAKVDIINHLSGNDIIAYDLEIDSVDTNTNTVTFTDSLPSDVAEEQWIALAKKSPVPMIPEEWHPVLLEMTVTFVAQTRSHGPQTEMALGRVRAYRNNLSKITDNRVVSKPHKVIGRAPFIGR